MSNHFGDRLFDAVKTKKTPLIVGLDPVYNRLPAAIRNHPQMNDENDVSASLDAITEFCAKVLKIVAPLVPAVKINSAYFEKYLWDGIETYYNLISEADALELEIIGDIKRGDIGHTAAAYAQGHIQNPEFIGLEDYLAPDAVTVNGFAGTDGIAPFADLANEQGKGIFVWVRASNPSAGDIQDFADANGIKMFEKLAEVVAGIASEESRIGKKGYSNVGMVVGATSPEETSKLRQQYKNIWLLIPGYGSQGATAEDCVRFLNDDQAGAIVNSSRGIIYAYERDKYKVQFGDNWEKCIEQAVIDAKVELARAMQ